MSAAAVARASPSFSSSPSPHPAFPPFSRRELHQPLVDRYTPVRVCVYLLTACLFWLCILPCMVLVHFVKVIVNACIKLCTCTRVNVSGVPVCVCHPPLSVSVTDAVWVSDSVNNQSIISAVLVLNGNVSLAEVRQLINERILLHPGMSKMRYQLDKTNKQNPVWRYNHDFCLSHHVQRWRHWKQGSIEHEEETDTETEEPDLYSEWSAERCSVSLQSLLSSLVNSPISVPFSPEWSTPVWVFALLPGYANGCVIVFRCHHVLADGVLLSGVLLELLMDGKAPQQTETEKQQSADTDSKTTPLQNGSEQKKQGRHRQKWPPSLFRVCLSFCVSLLWTVLTGPYHIARLSFVFDDFNPLHCGRLSPHKQVGWSVEGISMDRVKRIKTWYGCSVNDVMMNVLVNGISRICDKRKDPTFTQQYMHFIVPINVRALVSASKKRQQPTLGNFFSVLLIPFSLFPASCSRRESLLSLTRQMNALKSSSAPLFMFICLYVTVHFLPLTVAHWVLDTYNDLASAIMTNNRSPDYPLYFAEKQLLYWVSWAPCRSNTALSQTILTYNGEMRVSFVVDRALRIPSAELIEMYEREFRRLEDTVPAEYQPYQKQVIDAV